MMFNSYYMYDDRVPTESKTTHMKLIFFFNLKIICQVFFLTNYIYIEYIIFMKKDKITL